MVRFARRKLDGSGPVPMVTIPAHTYSRTVSDVILVMIRMRVLFSPLPLARIVHILAKHRNCYLERAGFRESKKPAKKASKHRKMTDKKASASESHEEASGTFVQ